LLDKVQIKLVIHNKTVIVNDELSGLLVRHSIEKIGEEGFLVDDNVGLDHSEDDEGKGVFGEASELPHFSGDYSENVSQISV
jgi:hypothetical protein